MAAAAEMRRATWTADGRRLEIWTDERTYQCGLAVNAVRVPEYALAFLAQVIGLFDLAEVDALIRRVAKAARKLGPSATHAALAAEEHRTAPDAPRAPAKPYRGPEARTPAALRRHVERGCRVLNCRVWVVAGMMA